MKEKYEKLIPISVQNTISWIPVANASILFIWLYNCQKAGKDFKVFVKSLAILFGFALVFSTLSMLLNTAFSSTPEAISVINWLALYIEPLVLARILIAYEKKALCEELEQT